MNAEQLAEIRRRLLEEREQFLAEWERHGGDTKPVEDWDLRDPEERATHATSTTVDRQIASDDFNLLRKIDFALQRIEEGTYTQCDHCGQPIPTARLLAKPSASLCLSCQEEKDARKGN